MEPKATRDTTTSHRSDNHRRAARRCHLRRPIELWRLHGATDNLRGLAFETSFGYALGLELDAELVLLHLQPNLEQLMAFADRIHAVLQAQGWQPLEEPSTTRS